MWETDDPQEFLGLFGILRANPSQDRAIRQAGLVTAQDYQWTEILRRVLFPRVHGLAVSPLSGLGEHWQKRRDKGPGRSGVLLWER